jgi:hypothetical protein
MIVDYIRFAMRMTLIDAPFRSGVGWSTRTDASIRT